ncbi:hypothetical protein [Viridibacillus arvi]|uniref:hypothetical protein n=1 Tax=Viridibacillus arvi TaxID=263475 RepID=UPI0034CE34EA
MRNYSVDYATFNKEFFKDAVRKTDKIEWFDCRGIRKLDQMRLAEITLATTGTAGTFTSYLVTIIHKELGVITSHKFRFAEYFTMGNRVDERSDWKNPPCVISHICKDNGVARWYINIPHPDEIKKMGKQILRYIDMYK